MITTSAFKPAWWLPGAHLQTIFPNVLRQTPKARTRRERLELPDGDFLDLEVGPASSGPVILILHGLEGGIHSHYMGGLINLLISNNYNIYLMHFRGCSGTPNRMARSYHSGDTNDFNEVVTHVKKQWPDRSMAAIGFSLGGNALLKWLGEQGPESPLQNAVAVSVPFTLSLAADRLEIGFSRFYQATLLRRLRRSIRRKQAQHPELNSIELDKLTNFRLFDDRVTAPLNGFTGVDDYYERASCRPYLGRIHTPTLILHARDDPFMTPAAIPAATELAPPVTLELAEHGGHVGFIGGALPWQPCYWLETRICAYLQEQLPAS